MKTVSARAMEDPRYPQGGHVSVVLPGIGRTPVPCLFHLSPVDDGHGNGGGLPDGWPSGELEALEARATAEGLELVLGPEVSDCSALRPGMAIEIGLAGTQVRARFEWPQLGARKPQRRRNITLVPAPRSPTGQPANRRASSEGGATAALEATVRQNNQSPIPAPEIHNDESRTAGLPSAGPSGKDKSAMPPAPSIFDKLSALDAIADQAATADAAPRNAPQQTAASPPGAATAPVAGADPVVAMLVELKRDIEALKHEQTAHASPPQGTSDERRLYGMLAELRRDIEALKHHEAPAAPSGEAMLYGMLSELRRDIETLKHHEAHAPPAGEAALYGMLADLRRDIEALRHHEAAPPPASVGERQLYAMLSELRHDIHALQEHTDRGSPARAEAARSLPWQSLPWARGAMRPQLALPSWASVLALAVIPLAALYVVANLPSQQRMPEPAPAARVLPPAGPLIAAPVATEAPRGASPLFEALATGTVSPRGVNAAGMPVAEIVARINAERQASENGRISAEGEFWMRRYLMTQLGESSAARVLTQLGSIYAEGGRSAADYDKARRLWEMAAALGDGPAMCYLGQLSESGRGGVVDPRGALQWYDRARSAGGCAGATQGPAPAR